MNISANTVTVVIALCAILSPILVAIINNRYQLKMKRLEFSRMKEKEFQSYVHSIYENYLKSASRYIADPTEETEKLYGENYSIAFAYFPPNSHDMLKAINKSIRDHNLDSANEQLEELSIWLSKLMREILTW